jgi:predicted ribosome quality control (RQC) complex YloA/Tae2 family protein
LATCASAIEAANYLLRFYYSFSIKNKQGDIQQKAYLDKKTKLESYIASVQKRLREITTSNVFEESANILMANLHHIPARAESVKLFDFYHNKEREIKLKKDLSPQKNAENYYRKAKNLGVEILNLQKTIDLKSKELEEVEHDLSMLKDGVLLNKPAKQENKPKQEISFPYKRFEYEGFEIRVGKDSHKNDELIQHHSTKNDLWLHARNYAGSHVIVKEQAGKPFPQHVIEKAASLAAWYSKGKNESFCPVIVTERKYVRKAKRMAAGQVIVEKEKTFMVVPSKF